MSALGNSLSFVSLSIGDTEVLLKEKYLSRAEEVLDYTGLENTCYLKFIDETHEEVEKLLCEEETVEMAHGWQGVEEKVAKKYYIRKFNVTHTVEGSIVEVWGSAKSYAFEFNANFRTFINKTASEIFTEIMSEYCSEEDIVVEDTEGKHTIIQKHVSDDQFIRECLIPMASSAKGVSSREYWFYGVNGKEVHFHPPDSSLTAYKKYIIHADDEHPTRKFNMVQSDIGHSSGSIPLTVVGYDPLRKITLSHKMTQEEASLRFEDKVVDFKAEEGRYYRTPFDSESDVENLAKSVWHKMSYRDNKAVLVMTADPALEPGRLIEIEAFGGKERDVLEKSGFYFIDRCLFVITNRKYELTCSLSRNSHAFGSKDSVGTVVSGSETKSEVVTQTSTFGDSGNSIKKSVRAL